MAKPTIAADVLQPRDTLSDLPTQLPFDNVVLVEQRGHPRELIFVKVAGLRLRTDSGLTAQFASDLRADPIQILQRIDSLFVGWNVDAEQSWHG